MTLTEAFKKFQSRLSQILPTDDVIFKCKLIVEEVFTEDELAAIESLSTSSDRAAQLRNCFDEMINSTNFYTRLCDLIIVMEDFDTTTDGIGKLAKEMRKELHICKFYSCRVPIITIL